MKKILALTLMVILVLPSVFALVGLNHPTPAEIELLAGEEGRFRWAVQSVDETEDMTCNIVNEGDNPSLEIVYDDGEEFLVPKNSVRNVFASVTPSDSAESGRYEQAFCVECAREGSIEGVSAKPRFCTTSVVVDVVKERTKENYPIPPKSEPESNGLSTTAVAVILGVLVVVAVLAYLNRRNPKAPKKKANVTKKKKKR